MPFIKSLTPNIDSVRTAKSLLDGHIRHILQQQQAASDNRNKSKTSNVSKQTRSGALAINIAALAAVYGISTSPEDVSQILEYID